MLASISLGPTFILYTLAVLVVYQFIENYFISPRVTKVTMDIHPAIAVFATIFGAYTAGVIGAVLALPIAATIQGIIEIILLNRDNNE